MKLISNAFTFFIIAALAAARGKIKDSTGGALHFYAHQKVKPRWAKAGYRLVVGEHTFVKLVGRSELDSLIDVKATESL